MGRGPQFDIIANYRSPGPVASGFIEHQGPIDLIRGPWGSGKTVACVFKNVRHASNLFPVCRDGWVHVRTAGIRDTYREMAKTALQTWEEFFPRNGPYTASEKGAWTGGQDRPVKHILEWRTKRLWPEGWRMTPVRLEMEFAAIGEANLDSFFKGYEISMGWMNECDLLSEDVPGRLFGRTNRYPPVSEVAEWEIERLGFETDPDSGEQAVRMPRIVFGDYNPPDETNWTYKREIEDPEKWPDYHFFAQPSGLSPNAENRAGKKRHQYEAEERQFGGPQSPDARRNVHGEYAAKAAGTIVYSGFSLYKHRSDQKLDPLPGVPLLLGLDGGGRPACGIGQMSSIGQFRALREICADPDEVTGAARFAGYILDVLLRDFPGMPIRGAWGDPSDFGGVDDVHGQLAFMQTVSQTISVPIMPTETNEIGARTGSLEFYLGDIDAVTPRSIWCPSLKMTIRGFVSQYHLSKKATKGETDRLEIVKNEYSHIMNAWEYLLYGYRGRTNLVEGAAKAHRPGNVTPIRTSVTAKSDFDVFDV